MVYDPGKTVSLAAVAARRRMQILWSPTDVMSCCGGPGERLVVFHPLTTMDKHGGHGLDDSTCFRTWSFVIGC